MQDAALADRRTASASIDAYFEANLLMGQASHPPLEELTKRALKIKEENARLFVHWTSPNAQTECNAVGPATRCFCSHSYSSHAWYETSTKRVKCRVDGCNCTCFSYVPGRGATHLRCSCKHEHHEHRTADGRPGPCQHPGCGCSGFHSSWRCGSCNEPYDSHTTIFETAAERARAGKPSEANLGGWSGEKPHLDAVCGGVTRMTSLLSGVERQGVLPLPLTDGAVCPECEGEELNAMSSTAAVFANYDRKADQHVGRLRKLKQLSEGRERFAGGAAGHRLGGAPPAAAAAAAASGAGGNGALVPRPPPGAAGASSRSGAAVRAGARPPARPVVNANRPLSKTQMREIAAAAAEARAQGGAPPSAVPPQAAAAAATPAARSPGKPRSMAVAAPAMAPLAARTAAVPARQGPRGQAKSAVAAVRRERAAEAAEARMAAASLVAAPPA